MKILVLTMLMFLGASSLSARKIKPPPKAFDLDKISFCVGGLVSAKGNINTGTIEGCENKPVFGMGDAGGSVSVLFGKIGLVFNVMYSTGGFSRYPYDDESFVSTNTYHHLVFNPNLYLGWLILGINLWKPLSNTKTSPEGNVTEHEDIEPLREMIIGAMIPVFQNRYTRLNVDIRAGYVWKRLGEELYPASFSVGVSCYFKYRLPKSHK
jgi:hypothetical protein